jgi:DNA polymerase V
MEINQYNSVSYNASNDFDQWNVQSANATGVGAAANDFVERGIDLNEQSFVIKQLLFLGV